MKISEINPDILQKKCKLVNDDKIYIIIDYIKNIHEKNNIKIYNPVTHEIHWVPFNIIEIIEEDENENS